MAENDMFQHHDHLINIPLAVVLGTVPFWLKTLEEFGWAMTTIIIPTLSAALLTLQIIMLWRKYHK